MRPIYAITRSNAWPEPGLQGQFAAMFFREWLAPEMREVQSELLARYVIFGLREAERRLTLIYDSQTELRFVYPGGLAQWLSCWGGLPGRKAPKAPNPSRAADARRRPD
ncbi:MAG: hypothetical protein ACP5E5_06135 [Acidobacteriaceae bacterium]